MATDNFLRSRLAILALAAIVASLGVAPPVRAQEAPAAWRVECAGDGKTLECRAIQQMINREDKQLIVQLTARVAPDTKAPVLLIQLPLGIDLAEPVQLKVDNGPTERHQVQTCTNVGCLVSVPLKDPLFSAMRTRHASQDRDLRYEQAGDHHRRAAAGIWPGLRQGGQIAATRSCARRRSEHDTGRAADLDPDRVGASRPSRPTL